MSTAKGLGRGLAELGLDAILNDTDLAHSLCQVPTSQIDPDPHQARINMAPEALQELAASIKSHGIVQPLIVIQQGARFQLIAGERRWRAAQIAGLQSVPVVLGHFTPKQRQAVALVENIQREDLSAIEQARGMSALMNQHQLTHQELADTVGFSRSQVTNLLRLLQLSDLTQQALINREIQMGHARCLIGLSEQDQALVLSRVIEFSWSVRQTEQEISRLHRQTPKKTKTIRLDTSLSKQGYQFKVQKSEKKTTLEISVKDEDRWHALLAYLEKWCDKH